MAQVFHTSAYRVHVWHTRYEAEGRQELADRPRRGRAPMLGGEDRAWLRTALGQGLQTYGLPVTAWSIRDLQRVLKQERSLEVSIYTIHQELHAMGYRYRCPRHDLTHRQDAEAVAAAKQLLDWMQKKTAADPSRLHLVSVDECEVHTHPSLAKVWRLKGCPFKVSAAGEDRKFTVFSAVDYATGQVIWQLSDTNGEERCPTSLDSLAERLPADEPVVVVLDNVGYHKSRTLRAWWQEHAKRFQPFWLPAYSSQVNMIERLWRYVKAELACHHWSNDLKCLKGATETLLAMLTVRFHSTDRPTFRLTKTLAI